MATVTPQVTHRSTNKLIVISWPDMVTGDTIVPFDLSSIGMPALVSAVQFEGTFNGGTTVTMTASNDGGQYEGLQDKSGTDISDTAGSDPIWEVATACRYLLPTIASGSSDEVTCTVTIWGPGL